ncbi:YccS family putative transporter [Prolixibacter denitrificans]|uniref:Putative membrane protein (TIGR01666 family) n=1 Tax=Prolixibacter denitrificans TaxID=1541063 RepID=A0A2P8C684_9BACT|nr:YccS family putative transporter [Prolixibacter denitrificans]PSK80478.1 putative membrane protein (TIGR01666 family) [Prolixibacter denitrificans]GET22744.1 TIGR01666 family membrane protein [Prolixibacter denitrificans]
MWQELKNKIWYESVRQTFWRYPDRLMAMKATIAMALLSVPFVLTGYAYFGVTLALGALAGALAETDDHPKGRIKALVLTVLSFALSSASVEILRPTPWLFAIGLAGSTVLFILIGGLGERYRGVSFGAVLIAIYTMLGDSLRPAPYWQPILLPAGALGYGLLSLALLYRHPWRLLEEQLARGYLALSAYLEEKARLFPSNAEKQTTIRHRLAMLNIEMVNALERTKEVLNSYADALDDQTELVPYLRRFMLLQSLHERAASSHERYELLSSNPDNQALMEGFGQLLLQLAQATRRLADTLLTGVPYRHPVSLNWIVNALNEQLKQRPESGKQGLSLLLHNLTQSHRSLLNLSDISQRKYIPRLARDTRTLWERLKAQLHWRHPRLRHAVRLSTCFVIGFGLMQWLHIEKGEWILLTSLFVCQPSYSETRRRLFQRILGTFMGVAAGVAVVQILPTQMGQLVLMLLAAFYFFFWLRKRYYIAVIFITMFVLGAFNLLSGKGVAMMGPRMLDTVLGAALAIVSVRILWPDWQYKRLPVLISEALAKNTAYFKAILKEYRLSEEDDLDYRIARRQAHQADNALAMAWQDMQMEPWKQQRFRQQAFRLTYLNHALLSYLSALGAHRDIQQFIHPEMEEFSVNIEEALVEASQMLAGSLKGEPTCHMEPILVRLRERLSEMEDGTNRQQLVLLFNVAEVTDQLLQTSTDISR